MEEVKKAKLFRIFFWVGFAVAIAATLLEVARGRNANYDGITKVLPFVGI